MVMVFFDHCLTLCNGLFLPLPSSANGLFLPLPYFGIRRAVFYFGGGGFFKGFSLPRREIFFFTLFSLLRSHIHSAIV
jgi:hypothetical protein